MDLIKIEYDDILKYCERFRGVSESILLNILLKSGHENYNPSKTPRTMVVGSGDSNREGSVIREFHNIQYGIPIEMTKVISCDIQTRIGVRSIGDYDIENRGTLQGDAVNSRPWKIGLKCLEERASSYDFVLVNRPDYVGMDSYVNIFHQAAEFLSNDGLITVVSEADMDLRKMKQLRELLVKDTGFKLEVEPIKIYEKNSTNILDRDQYCLLNLHF